MILSKSNKRDAVESVSPMFFKRDPINKYIASFGEVMMLAKEKLRSETPETLAMAPLVKE